MKLGILHFAEVNLTMPGIETGPGAVLTGVAGGYAGGKAGEQTAKWVFDGVKWVCQKIR